MHPDGKPFDGHPILDETRAFLGERHQLLINGQWSDGTEGETLESRDPATGLTVARFAVGGAADADRAVAAARNAFEGGWGRTSPKVRAAALRRLAALIESNAELFTQLEIIDNGMPQMIARLTVSNCVEMLDYYAGLAWQIEGSTLAPPTWVADQAEALTYTVREPVGVAAQIIPWNVPMSMAILKLAPALAAGCTVVMKPSEETPLTALLLGRLVCEAGLPDGVVNIVNGLGSKVGARLAAHPNVDKIAFTGSTATGRAIVQAALGNLKKVTLELGGKSPVVVMPDVDMDLAIPGVGMATYFLGGQNCMAGTRIFAHAAIHDQLVEGLAAFSKMLTVGHGLDPASMIGPMVSEIHCGKVMGYIERGLSEGARLVTGGQRLDRPGTFVEPTIFADCTPDMAIVRDEIFGPVMAVMKFDSDDVDTIARLANDSPYGLSGSVWTQDLSTAHRLVSRIRSGHVSINCHGAVGSNVPFGGYGQSGWGREFGTEGLSNYLETKAVTARL
ncbi:aldehyde dehydrogenase family protein [Sphingomonas lacunae]|uniref:Aldehyde dehydrogenase family protein n=1 Tax=Sphingomonas lacunae TaxID=2698828 RepID=A0A6M4AZ01_9SPHN|nr:aldehyde dehydrogenase family protein [Sphingomonas lacunae]QJQ33602.1 aldehyde dehydrogenase family protein [Sphingomonas lacunae]